MIVGLGNPGSAYDETRHNIGYLVVRLFAERLGARFKREPRLMGQVAQATVKGKKLVLLLPETYMNGSGQSVRQCLNYFKPGMTSLIVVSDDAALPFGKLRYRRAGSSGGHNGLKSIEEHLKTQQYPRLRVGIGSPQQEGLAEYVLGRFTAEERGALSKILEDAADTLEKWVDAGADFKEN